MYIPTGYLYQFQLTFNALYYVIDRALGNLHTPDAIPRSEFSCSYNEIRAHGKRSS